ncbi:hypothetical protein [Neolewinella agarilytica]|uniref:Uncharacterized protein n=1 Tax=Neolewinella agarilytica TaxID=478744 RepID=A0A1H9LEH1_9BACT|nr:hypothetical protein [Neolewinella agarilytica]SER09794.1 hypothetical protein SAMN05444359_1244 [Neolewinella agarilytica]
MKTYFSLLSYLLLLLLLPATAMSQSSTTIDAKSYGYSFKSPAGWIHQDLQNGSHFFGSNTIPGLIAVYPHAYDNREEVRAYAQANGMEEDGMLLAPVGQIENFSTNGISGIFTGWAEGSPIKAAMISLFSPHGGGVSIIVMTSPDKFDASYPALAKSVANSVMLVRPVESQLAQQWRQGLSNKKLTYFNTTSNSTEKRTLMLYENGRFVYGDQSSYSSSDYGSDFSSASQSDDAGQWKILGDGQAIQLQLTYNDGSISQHSLQMKEGTATQILLDGRRYFTEDL